MSSSIYIPVRKNPMAMGPAAAHTSASASPSASSASSSLSLSLSLSLSSGTPHTPPQMPSHSPSSSVEVGVEVKSEWRSERSAHDRRRVSLLSSSLSAQEHTVINVGHPDGPPRLITCVKTSQGFDWNQEIFLPSHSSNHENSDCPDLERRKDPVHEIVLTDEELENMFPQ